MSPLVWWAVPAVVTVVAAAAAYWRTRPRSDDHHRSIQQFQRFRDALGAPRHRATREEHARTAEPQRRVGPQA